MKLSNEYKNIIDDSGKYFRNIIKAYKKYQNMEIGQYLIRKTVTREYNRNKGTISYKWKTTVFGKYKIVRKYKIVALDEHNIPFIRAVLHNGQLDKKARYIGNQDPNFVIYSPDPDQINFTLLGGDPLKFNPVKIYKEERKQ